MKGRITKWKMQVQKRKISYGLYFMGQNVFYGLIGYMTTYFTDIGITAALVAIVALITKVWDAINDPIFGMIMDKVNFKKGKFHAVASNICHSDSGGDHSSFYNTYRDSHYG